MASGTISVKRTKSRTLFFLLKILISGIILFVLVQKISLPGLWTAVKSAENLFIVTACLLLPLNLFLQYLKWKLVIHQFNPKVRSNDVLSSLFIGILFGLVTPGRIGDYARTLFVKDVDKTELLGLFLVDKAITLFAIYLLGALGLLQFVSILMQNCILTIIIVLGLFFLITGYIFYRRGFRFHPQNWILVKKVSFLIHLFKGVGHISRPLVRKLVFLTFIHVFTYCTQLFLLILAFHPIAFPNAMSAAFAVMFTKSVLPISFGDLGVREGAAVYFFGRFGVPSAAAFNASLLLFLINILIPGLIGIFVFMLRRNLYNKGERIA